MLPLGGNNRYRKESLLCKVLYNVHREIFAPVLFSPPIVSG